MYSDRSFVYGVYQAAKGHAKYAPVYVYKIDYAGQYSYAPIFKGTNETINYKFGKFFSVFLFVLSKIYHFLFELI